MNRLPSWPRLRRSDLVPCFSGASWAKLESADRVRLTYSGRAGIHQYLTLLRSEACPRPERKQVLVPAFHCPTVVDPILHAGYDVRFFSVNERLDVVEEDLLRKLDSQVAAVLFIRYFGVVEPPAHVVAACRDAGARIIEDCCHSFLAANPVRLACSGADATIYSFWKLLPSLVGGGVLLQSDADKDAWPPQVRPSARDSWVRLKAIGRQLMEEQLELVPRALRNRIRAKRAPLVPRPVVRKPAAEAYPYDPATSRWHIPASAKLLLQAADLDAVAHARRRNYETLARTLVATRDLSPLRSNLPVDSCPWGFPVLLQARQERDYLLHAQGVPVFTFGEVLHPLLFTRHSDQPAMLRTASYLADTLLAFAVHQRLDTAHVENFAQIVNDFVSRL